MPIFLYFICGIPVTAWLAKQCHVCTRDPNRRTPACQEAELLEALNMEKMMSAISCWMESSKHSLASADCRSSEEIPVLIIEGFLLFNYKPLDSIWNRSYFLTIPYEECKRRRSTRVYEPPDPPGYFDGHVWPMYLKHRQEIQDITWQIVYLDGTKSEEDVFSQVYEDVIQELAKRKGLQETA
uniref:Nicotinamide riboside kinase 1 n=1 Tax=Equus caballus TaxID=9796 RepID=A0A5F5PXU5_HORSE